MESTISTAFLQLGMFVDIQLDHKKEYLAGYQQTKRGYQSKDHEHNITTV